MSSKLLNASPHEVESQTELSLRESHALLHQSLKPPFPLAIPSPSEYTRLISAIAYGILTEPHLAKTHFTHLAALVTDGYNLFVTTLVNVVDELYKKLVGPSRIQLIWVCSKLVDVSAIDVEILLVALLRQINGGDFTDVNLWLSMELIRLFMEKWDWVSSEPMILTSALFTYLRLLSDHYRLSGLELDKLKRQEIDFCIRVLRECFGVCLKIGRDLVRLLQDVVHIPEFRDLWKDLLYNPSVFRVPGFSDIAQIFRLRTSSRYLLLRIRPEMETQLRFLLTHVKWGSQKRYQIWFAKKFLCGFERETIISDIIRFVCCAHHPSNEIIQSDVISRWALIGWLLKCCRRNHFEANAKLALFYDWLFFDEKVDNIMNIEPAVLLMVHSIPKYVDTTHSLLEFLFLLVDNYDLARKDMIVRGVSASFSAILRKGVLHSFDTLISCKSLSLLKERLSMFLPNLESGIARAALTCHPLHPMPANLPGLSNVECGTPQSRKLGLPTNHERSVPHIKVVDAAVREAVKDSISPNSLPLNSPSASAMSHEKNGFHSEAIEAAVGEAINNPSVSFSLPFDLPSPSDVESRPLHFRKSGPPMGYKRNGLQTEAVDAAFREAIEDSQPHLPANHWPLNFHCPSDAESRLPHVRKLASSACLGRSGLHTEEVDVAIQEAVQDASAHPQEVLQDASACLPANPMSLNLPSPSDVEKTPPHSRKLGLSKVCEENGLHSKTDIAIPEASRDASAQLPLPMSMSLLSRSSVESGSLQFRELGLSVGDKICGVHGKAVDAAVQILHNTASCGLIKSNQEQVGILEGSVHDLRAAVEESRKTGLGTLEKILFSYAASGSGEFETAIGGSPVFSSDELACQITETFRLNGYEMFTPINRLSAEVDYDDETQSATAVVIRTFFLSPNERMKDLLFFWTTKGYAVGPRFLSYVSRLAYEASMMGDSKQSNEHKKLKLCFHDGRLSNGDAMTKSEEHKSSDSIDSEKSLLMRHIDCYFSFMRDTDKYPPNVIIPSMTYTKFVDDLVENAFVAYRGFLKFSSMKMPQPHVHGIHRMEGTQSMLLLSDLKYCCGWRAVKSKSLFCNIFYHLPDLSTAREDFIRLLVDVLDHVDLINIQIEVGLKRFSIFGEDTETVSDLMKSTCYWDFAEQQKLWGLLISELAVSKIQAEKIVLNLCSGFLDISKNPLAVEGLLKLLRSHCPTRELVAAIISLPNAFGDFAAAVLCSWVTSNSSMFFAHLADLLRSISNTDGGSMSYGPISLCINHSAITGLLNFLNNDGMRSSCNSTLVVGIISEIKAKLSYMMEVHDSGLTLQ